jgi:hypothetical protein
MIKFIKVRATDGTIIRHQTEDGRFVIRRNYGIGIGQNRWVIRCTDGTTPFNGYRSAPKACASEIVQTIAEAKEVIEHYGYS